MTHPSPSHRRLLALVLLCANACAVPEEDADDELGAAPAYSLSSGSSTGGGPSPCEQACQELDECGLCLSLDGECVDLTGCVAECEASAFDAACVNGAGSCDEEALAGCFGSDGSGSSGAGGTGASGGSGGTGGAGGEGGSCEMTRYYFDGDDDGHGDAGDYIDACAPSGNYDVTTAGDCCDADGDAHPEQTEFFNEPTQCGGFDYDCNDSDELEVAQCGSVSGCTSTWSWCPVPGCGVESDLIRRTPGETPGVCVVSNLWTKQRCR
jgi:hypothetical protein